MIVYCQKQKLLSYVALSTLFVAVSVLLIHQQAVRPVNLQPIRTGRNPSVLIPQERASDPANTCFYYFDMIFQSYTSAYRDCLLEKLDKKSIWDGIHEAIEACLGGSISRLLQMRELKNKDDTKIVIMPASKAQFPNSDKFDCVEITLGVGDDIDAEIQLSRLLPRCRFYGADPIRNSGEIFKHIGNYYELAVASPPGTFEASVLINGEYQMKNVTALSLTDFLVNYAKVDHVDFMFMDAEGAEYGIFKQFIGGGWVDGEDDITICQISVEMHGPLSVHKMEKKFDQLITAVINSSSYLPVWSTSYGYHSRAYYINIKDKYCLKTYFADRFCASENDLNCVRA